MGVGPLSRGTRFLIVGGAGFIGSHFTDALLADGGIDRLTLYDNFTSGRDWHFESHRDDKRLDVVRADVHDLDLLTKSMTDHDVVIHLASNPDIARAMTEPEIDFHEGTALTNNVLEAMRRSGVPRILYASGSGVYGDLGDLEVPEDHGPLLPISTYGASKLAGEALIGSYCHMFGISGCVFRFGNVVGPRQTHGVGLDFVRRLLSDRTQLRILGDGSQSKSYIHVLDVVAAVLTAHEQTVEPFQAYNVATGDSITVLEIANLALDVLGLDPASVTFEFTGGNRGWAGDVPVVRLDTRRIRALGWQCARSSREALRASLISLLEDAGAGRI